MTVSTLIDRSPDVQRHLLPTLEAATSAARDAHEAARALTDAVSACWYLPADLYWQVPDVSHISATLRAATRAAATAARYATANPTVEHLRALDHATAAVLTATTAVRETTHALRTAAARYFDAGHMRHS